MDIFTLAIVGWLSLGVIYADDGDDDEVECPETLPIKIEGRCYSFSTDMFSYGNAKDHCEKLADHARITSVQTPAVLQEIERRAWKFVSKKLEKAYFWLGMVTNDQTYGRAAEDRDWEWHLDESEFVQKDYPLWETKGGPSKKAFTCGVLNPSKDYLVKPVDCGGPRIPVLCMAKEGARCSHNVLPFMEYGKYCVASINGALEYNKILGSCNPHKATQYLEDQREAVKLAAINSFLGGGIFMNIQRGVDGKFRDLDNNSEPLQAMWEEGEPRGEYDCVGLSVQADTTLKMKTMNCEFMLSSLCVLGE